MFPRESLEFHSPKFNILNFDLRELYAFKKFHIQRPCKKYNQHLLLRAEFNFM